MDIYEHHNQYVKRLEMFILTPMNLKPPTTAKNKNHQKTKTNKEVNKANKVNKIHVEDGYEMVSMLSAKEVDGFIHLSSDL